MKIKQNNKRKARVKAAIGYGSSISPFQTRTKCDVKDKTAETFEEDRQDASAMRSMRQDEESDEDAVLRQLDMRR